MTLAAEFSKPSIEYSDISPLLIIFGVAAVGVLVEAFVGRRSRYLVQTVLSLVGVLAALVATVLVACCLIPAAFLPRKKVAPVDPTAMMGH